MFLAPVAGNAARLASFPRLIRRRMRASSHGFVMEPYPDDQALRHFARVQGPVARDVAKGSGNRHFVRMYTGLTPQYNRLSLTLLSAAKTAGPAYKAYFNKVNDDHRRLIAAIQARGAAAADRLALNHARLVAERLQSFIWQSLADPIALRGPPRIRKAKQGGQT
jgi:DNA-binding FadR family transcriptional regulator